MKVLLRLSLFFLTGLLLSAHSGCSPSVPTPIIYDISIISTSDGDRILETTDTSATIEIKGRQIYTSSSIKLCRESNCFFGTFLNNSYPYRVQFSGLSALTTGIASIYLINPDDDPDSNYDKWSNICYFEIY
jgi:hypothetical protein